MMMEARTPIAVIIAFKKCNRKWSVGPALSDQVGKEHPI